MIMRLGQPLLAVALLCALAIPAAAETRWQMGSAKRAPEIGATFDEEAVAALIGAQETVSQVQIQFIGNEQEMIQQVIRGRLNMGATTPLGLSAAFPDISVLTIPYLWNSEAERIWVYENHVEPLISEIFAGSGIILLSVQEAGYNGVFCAFDCSDVATLKGERFRVSASAASRMFWESLDAITVNLPLPETWSALEQGLVKGAELPMAYYATTPAAQSAPHFVHSQHTHSPWIYFVNARSWNALSPEEQAAVLEAQPASFSGAARFAEDGLVRQEKFVADGGHAYVLDDTQLAAWRALVEPNIPTLVEGMSPGARKLYDAIEAGKAAYAAEQG